MRSADRGGGSKIIEDPLLFGDVVDGKHKKSGPPIGVKGSDGRYVAALCFNIDLTLFRDLQNTLAQFISVDTTDADKESLNPAGVDARPLLDKD